jgi:hypothetical protein
MSTNARAVPGRYYLVRTPKDRQQPMPYGTIKGNKRDAIGAAKSFARRWASCVPVRDRRISVYTVDHGQRPTLLFQCHVNRRTGKIVSEQL